MPFGKRATGETRLYLYRARPVEPGQLPALRAEFARRTHLWNRLVALQRETDGRRGEIADRAAGLSDEAIAAERAHLADLFARRDEAAYAEVHAIERARSTRRRPAWNLPDVRAALAELDRERYERAKAALYEPAPDAPPWWCNSNAVRQAWDVASKPRKGKAPADLRFHRAADEATLDVQIIGGMAVADLLGGEAASGPLQMGEAHVGSRRCDTPMRLRFRPASEGEAGMSDWLVCLHRPMPADGRVQGVKLMRRRLADTTVWHVLFAVRTPARPEAETRPGTVSVDLGWRRTPDGLRVAVWRDGDGRTGDLTLPGGWLAERRRVDRIQSRRDKAFDAVRARFTDWLASGPVPDWLHEETRHLARWRAPGRLVALLRRWADRRFAGDGDAYDGLMLWYYHDLHEYQWQAHLLDQLNAQRREVYRVFAARLAREYGVIVLEDTNWAELALTERRERPAADAATQTGRAVEDATDHHRQWAAPGSLDQTIALAANKYGARLERVAAPGTTSVCAVCGAQITGDRVALVRECRHCGARMDQDENAVRVIAQDWAAIERAGA